tara:strand:- start:139 stop:684 length:546 start_codon:yes stop_codon:yes gene_type:complete
MKLNNFVKYIPLISTIVLVLVLNISNNKVNTKLRILIWSTPPLSIGTYLAISTGAGFMISYIITNNLGSIYGFKSSKSIKYKPINKIEDDYDYTSTDYTKTNEKILIERNINDPSPTINAQFRVIGKAQQMNYESMNNTTQSENTIFNDYESFVDTDSNNENIKQRKESVNDWNDDSFKSW